MQIKTWGLHVQEMKLCKAPQTGPKHPFGHLQNPFQLGAELKEWPSPHFYGRKLSLRPTLIGIVDLWTIFVVLRCFEYAESKVHIPRWLAMDSLQELPCPGEALIQPWHHELRWGSFVGDNGKITKLIYGKRRQDLMVSDGFCTT